MRTFIGTIIESGRFWLACITLAIIVCIGSVQTASASIGTMVGVQVGSASVELVIAHKGKGKGKGKWKGGGGGGSGGGPKGLSGTYYVRKTGSNGNVGTSAGKAWRTISHALNQTGPSDTIYIGAGTYNEKIKIETDDSSAHELKLIGDPNGTYTGDAGEVRLKWGEKTIEVSASMRVAFTNLVIDGNNSGDTVIIKESNGTTFTSCQFVNGGDDAIEVDDHATMTMRSCEIIDPADEGIDIEKGTAVVEDCLIQDPGDNGIELDESSDTVTVRRTRIVGAGKSGVYIKKGNGVIVNCAIVGCNQRGVYVKNNHDAEVINSTIADCSHHGIECGSNSVMKIHNNIIAHVSKNALKGKGHSSSTQSDNIFWAAGHGYVGGGAKMAGSDRTVDPMLTSLTIPRIGAGSPAISTAMDATSWTSMDIDSRSRPYLGGWDVGAYEYDPSEAPLFVDVSNSAGFEKTLTNNYAMYSAGLHWGDVDNDGDLDCFATGSGAHLFKNDGDGTFTAASFSNDPSRQGALADFDNDGDLDFWGGRSLYYEAYFENNGVGGYSYGGNAGFPEVWALDGVTSNDFDGDGWCDLVVCGSSKRWIAMNDGEAPLNLTGDWSSSTGLTPSPASGDNTSSGDVNGDGKLDFLHHSGNTKLFLSDGDGTFTLYSSTGISEPGGGNYDKRGSAWGDYDNDGDLDLVYCAENSGERLRLYRNDIDWDLSSGSFAEVGGTAGLSNTDVQRGCSWGDFDNDGDLDLLIAVYDGADVIYENQGAPSYNFVALDNEPVSSRKGNDAVFVDFDNDGDLDIAVSNESGDSVLLKNSTNDTNYLKVRVVGSGAGGTPKSANGVKVELYAADGTTYLGQRTIFAARGFAGTTPQWAHFGVADPAAAYVVKVYFNNGLIAEKLVTPSAVSSTIGGNPVAQMITIDESDFGKTRPVVVKWDEVSPVE